MSKYTTGELAKLCGVSVRTVQYYDTRGILVPGELSEGGRRIYGEDDLRRMKIICFLRDLDLPIDSIKRLLSEEHPERVISLLLDEQQASLEKQSSALREKSERIGEVRQALKRLGEYSVESIGDVAHIMNNRKKLYRIRFWMILTGLIMDIIWVGTILLWVLRGIWLPFALGLPVVVGMGVWVSSLYFNNVAFICPRCHTVFKPQLGDSFFAPHTPNTRRLHCPSCGHHGFCVETYGGREKKS